MRLPLFIDLLALASLGYAMPKNDCSTVTAEVIVPSTTATYLSTAVVYAYPTTAEDLGTFTYVTTISTTTTLETLTSTHTACVATSIITAPAYPTAHTTHPKHINHTRHTTHTNHANHTNHPKRAPTPTTRDATCTFTTTTTTLYGQTYTFLPTNQTTTFTDYTSFTQATITQTSHDGKAYTIATAHTTLSVPCPHSNDNNTTFPPSPPPTPTSLAPHCSPSAQTSAYEGYGLAYAADVPFGGATYTTHTPDPSRCCQLCAEAEQCSASAWDSRDGECRLEFAVGPESGELVCGEGVMALYDYGPVEPMRPGAGFWVAAGCGNVGFGAAGPDDGT